MSLMGVGGMLGLPEPMSVNQVAKVSGGAHELRVEIIDCLHLCFAGCVWIIFGGCVWIFWGYDWICCGDCICTARAQTDELAHDAAQCMDSRSQCLARVETPRGNEGVGIGDVDRFPFGHGGRPVEGSEFPREEVHSEPGNQAGYLANVFFDLVTLTVTKIALQPHRRIGGSVGPVLFAKTVAAGHFRGPMGIISGRLFSEPAVGEPILRDQRGEPSEDRRYYRQPERNRRRSRFVHGFVHGTRVYKREATA